MALTSSAGFKQSYFTGFNSGFTLVEMLVVISIFIIVTATLLANLPAFRNKTALDLVAQEVAITIRQAQVFGVGTRSFTGDTFPSHGVYFDKSVSDSFVLFADLDPDGNGPNGQYDPGDGCGGSSTECREQFIFKGGVELSDLLGCTGGSPTDTCGASPASLDLLTVVFRRPEPGAKFVTVPAQQAYNQIQVVIASTQDGATRNIGVWLTGHIYVEQ
jgi:prepilin-type N-terminal cleavage/methylation domain-containing protein